MVGETISHFRVLEKLGEGGMGVVYKAEDTRLGRIVALKFLAPHAVGDTEAQQRFEREARAAATLEHPNICTVFEIGEVDGRAFLAMSFIEGRTVKDKISERPLKLREALDIAAQTARGLQAAHEKGVVHRDVKPANVMIGGRGQVKIMDFGLAQLAAGSRLTQTGSSAGTPAYMSPEQAEGRATDRRTDIWSLGVMLYEMVTGQLPFQGERQVAMMVAIAHSEPEPTSALRSGVPLELDRIIAKCLAKDPSARYQHADDLTVDLEALRGKIDSGKKAGQAWNASVATAQPKKLNVRLRAWLIACSAVVAVLVLFVLPRLLRIDTSPPPRTVKFAFIPKQLLRGGDSEIDAEVSISRDGKHITYVESQGRQLWIRDLDQEQARPVPGATGVYQAFWSNDDQYIGYSVGQGPDLMRIPSHGGTPKLICKMAGAFRRAAWSSDGTTIVYCDTTGLYTVPAMGGEPALVIKHPHIEHPSFLDLPGGRRAFLFQAVDRPGVHDIFVQVEGENERHPVVTSSSNNPYPDYSPTGHIVYVDGDIDAPSIWALPFSLKDLKAAGKPFPIAQRASSPQVSRTGTLVYSDVPSNLAELVWRDRSGKVLPAITDPRIYRAPSLSPDGRKVAVSFVQEGKPRFGVFDLQKPKAPLFEFDAPGAFALSWSPSGNEMVYAAGTEGNLDIFSRAADGNSAARVLVSTPTSEIAPEWSHDQKYLIYVELSAQTRGDMFYRERLADGSLGSPAVFLKTEFNEGAPRFSPDGRYVAYFSNESGKSEVYVRSFPGGAGKQQISTNGGVAPHWSNDGREIVYMEGQNLMAVPVTVQPAFSSGLPSMLFPLGSAAPQFDVSADGKRFLVRQRLPEEKPLAVHVAHNWFSEFRGRD